jgi:hypothetical protein
MTCTADCDRDREGVPHRQNRNWQQQQEDLGRTNRLLFLIRHGQHWKRRIQQFFYCFVCIRYRGNVSTEPLPSNDRGIFTESLPSKDKGIFTEPLPINDKGIFTEPLPSNDRGIHRERNTHRQQRDLISLLLFFQNKEQSLKIWSSAPDVPKRYVPPKRRLTLNGLHGVISQKIILFITTAVRTSNPT